MELKIDPSMSMAILSQLLDTNIITRKMIEYAIQHINASSSSSSSSSSPLPNQINNIINHEAVLKGTEQKKTPPPQRYMSESIVKQEPNDTTMTVDGVAPMLSSSTSVTVESTKVTTVTTAAAHDDIRTRHIALHVYYDGGTYSGLAENIGQVNDTSIERAVFVALKKANFITSRDEHCQYSRCGRTDKGVSACGQIIAMQMKSAFPIAATLQNPNHPDASDQIQNATHNNDKITNDELPKNSFESRPVWVPPRKNKNKDNSHDNGAVVYTQKCIKEYAYDKILNNLLPPDIRILGWCPVSANFSARFSCTTRTYRYFFMAPKVDTEEDASARQSQQQLHRNGILSIERMKQGLQYMIGTHDFRNFCKMDVEKVYNFVRTIHSADIVVESTLNNVHICFLHIVGQAFLWHQIRCIVHVLFLIGRGYEDPSIVLDLLNIEQHPGKPSYPLADERPLVLHECQYTNLSIGYSVANLWNILNVQEQQWEDHVLAAARIRNCSSHLKSMIVRIDELLDFATSKMEQRSKKQRGANQQVPNTTLRPPPISSLGTVTWGEALSWLEANGIIPDPSKLVESVYTPLLDRSKGTTYEEKVKAIQLKDSSSKRQQKYETNVIKKRKTKEEDAAFYNHMTQQGGSSL